MNEIQGDEVFTRFRRKLEDAVTVAINSGTRVGRKFTDHCPLGCVGGQFFPVSHRPGGGVARLLAPWIAESPSMAPTSFAEGFDGLPCTHVNDETLPYYLLGLLYRARFP